jgi:hypothetical protein
MKFKTLVMSKAEVIMAGEIFSDYLPILTDSAAHN